MGGHRNSSQAALFQEINFIGQGRDMGKFERIRFLTPRPLKFRKSAYKKREARFMVLTVEPCPVLSPKGSLHRKVKEAGVRVGLESHAPNSLTVSSAQLVFQEEVILEQRKNRRNSMECFTKMDEDSDLKNRIGIEMD
jgi:hypothetical protein